MPDFPSLIGRGVSHFRALRLPGLLALSKDADPDIPILKQANSEYAALH
jgi:hypothetical protein